MWLTSGIIIGLAVLAIVWWANKSDIQITWYEWVIGLLGLILLLFTAQNYFASIAEGEPKAASMFLLATGLPSIVLLGVAWQFVYRRTRKA